MSINKVAKVSSLCSLKMCKTTHLNVGCLKWSNFKFSKLLMLFSCIFQNRCSASASQYVPDFSGILKQMGWTWPQHYASSKWISGEADVCWQGADQNTEKRTSWPQEFKVQYYTLEYVVARGRKNVGWR